jgi:uncharacterized protein (DUF1697 family)
VRRLAVLLRAVNVGGTGKLPMAELKALLGELGYDRPETLLASGNAVIGTAEPPAAVERKVAAALADRFGLKTQVLVLDAQTLRTVIADNPFVAFAKAEPSKFMVMFLDAEPTADGVAALAPLCEPGEEVKAGSRALYLTYPQGSGRSKLYGVAIERLVGARGTSRNWNTVGKLAEKLA